MDEKENGRRDLGSSEGRLRSQGVGARAVLAWHLGRSRIINVFWWQFRKSQSLDGKTY